ncbi:hypothetical protein [Synechococcus sp. PCC 6312]|uniref:hypothetical protein n=1 Tax=Synechococcus sp. (strain ATCC 27167 / PCC 6312) TaxID=195253 RepID=UPI00029F3801|nr:hypothetical protein [Synechococcus sp. PCC 6312]AFY61959.1 hypothetical protein Syn6312_2896 [Synechococcus sp. PCC 6312]
MRQFAFTYKTLTGLKSVIIKTNGYFNPVKIWNELKKEEDFVRPAGFDELSPQSAN